MGDFWGDEKSKQWILEPSAGSVLLRDANPANAIYASSRRANGTANEARQPKEQKHRRDFTRPSKFFSGDTGRIIFTEEDKALVKAPFHEGGRDVL